MSLKSNFTKWASLTKSGNFFEVLTIHELVLNTIDFEIVIVERDLSYETWQSVRNVFLLKGFCSTWLLCRIFCMQSFIMWTISVIFIRHNRKHSKGFALETNLTHQSPWSRTLTSSLRPTISWYGRRFSSDYVISLLIDSRTLFWKFLKQFEIFFIILLLFNLVIWFFILLLWRAMVSWCLSFVLRSKLLSFLDKSQRLSEGRLSFFSKHSVCLNFWSFCYSLFLTSFSVKLLWLLLFTSFSRAITTLSAGLFESKTEVESTIRANSPHVGLFSTHAWIIFSNTSKRADEAQTAGWRLRAFWPIRFLLRFATVIFFLLHEALKTLPWFQITAVWRLEIWLLLVFGWSMKSRSLQRHPIEGLWGAQSAAHLQLGHLVDLVLDVPQDLINAALLPCVLIPHDQLVLVQEEVFDHIQRRHGPVQYKLSPEVFYQGLRRLFRAQRPETLHRSVLWSQPAWQLSRIHVEVKLDGLCAL